MGKNRYYIAYGSNLSVAQMAFRCPDAKVVGKAILKDWRLVFRLHATIEPAEGYAVPVVIWKISSADEARLDRYEGFPKYYIKQNIRLTAYSLNGEHEREITGMAYIMTNGIRDIIPPTAGYYATIYEGYERFGFNKQILRNAASDAFMYRAVND
ncbi:MAG: gamma-glutamylcyclotransferase [Bacteroidales bacterium]|nr:gamma-glutamylcyclotransferase [Bacteroidales bacterium]